MFISSVLVNKYKRNKRNKQNIRIKIPVTCTHLYGSWDIQEVIVDWFNKKIWLDWAQKQKPLLSAIEAA